MNKKIPIAKVISAFGIKGEVKLAVYSKEPQKIEKYQLFYASGDLLKLKFSNKNKTVIGSANGDPMMIAKIDGVDDRNKAEELRGIEIFTERDNFSKTKKNEFYYVDLVGLDVLNMNSQKIGKVINVYDYGAGGVIEVEFLLETLPKDYQPIENFPFKNAIFPEVNLAENFIMIDLLEGLLL